MFPSIAKTSLFQLSVLPVPLFFTTFGNKRPYVTASHNINNVQPWERLSLYAKCGQQADYAPCHHGHAQLTNTPTSSYSWLTTWDGKIPQCLSIPLLQRR